MKGGIPMKKYIAILPAFILILSISACTSGTKDERTLETFKNAYTEAGIVLENEDVPFFGMIGAKDGIIFYMNGQKVAIYEFETEKSMKDSELIANWPTNGRFALESSDEEAITIFNGVEEK
jgi:hypothetical protein